ncbi:MAG: hypothetical protein ACTHO8_08945 [Solirubrobacterales bacterium]
MRRLGILGTVLAIASLAISLGITPSSSATVLCKTASNPCSGGTYGKGTAVEMSLKSGTASVLDAPYGEVKCTESAIKGEVSNPGGEGSVVSGSIGSLSFGGCGGDTVTVLEKGSFKVEAPKEGNGTLKLEGFKFTVIHLGVHCIYSGTVSFTLKGGEMASTSGSPSVPRTGGNSGAFCGESAPWTVEFTVKAPEPLYVEGP